ncbi:putative acetate kinase [Vanrija pseudolonga]|uniref:Probable acetate kinase n=1 Tax=Vanrija pseudolonga TaxID=143232 RepID=A0AAF0XZA3_9TREE|nr:putative acetate kinase [Vanrija pseudolonga]
MYILALNCGSSSIKGKLFALPATPSAPLAAVATLAVSNIGAKGDNVTLRLKWDNGPDERQTGPDGGAVEHRELFPWILDHIARSGAVKKDDIKYITHRIVHGGTNTKGLVVTADHREALGEMDALSEFAPLHNHHAVLGVKACLDVLPQHTSLLLFDTLFHQTIPPEVYTYALPPPDGKLPIPLRKYGFHGLSYASIVRSLASYLGKPTDTLNIVVAHLGSGASSACIRGGKSIDTSMGLTPLEGLVGGTRTGTIDPTAIFHHTKDYWTDAGLPGIKVSKAEALLNKKSGLTALAGTPNFATITTRANDPTSAEHARAKLAYDVFVDRLMGFVSQYLAKLLATLPIAEIDGLVFSGGIGENAAGLRADVLQRLGWLGTAVDAAKNDVRSDDVVREITVPGSKLRGWVILTDEEGYCAQAAREQLAL